MDSDDSLKDGADITTPLDPNDLDSMKNLSESEDSPSTPDDTSAEGFDADGTEEVE